MKDNFCLSELQKQKLKEDLPYDEESTFPDEPIMSGDAGVLSGVAF